MWRYQANWQLFNSRGDILDSDKLLILCQGRRLNAIVTALLQLRLSVRNGYSVACERGNSSGEPRQGERQVGCGAAVGDHALVVSCARVACLLVPSQNGRTGKGPSRREVAVARSARTRHVVNNHAGHLFEAKTAVPASLLPPAAANRMCQILLQNQSFQFSPCVQDTRPSGPRDILAMSDPTSFLPAHTYVYKGGEACGKAAGS